MNIKEIKENKIKTIFKFSVPSIIAILLIIGALFAVTFRMLGRKYAALFGCSAGVADMVSSGFRFLSVSFLIMG